MACIRLVVAAAVAAVTLAAAPAGASVTVTPTHVDAGTTTTIGFTVNFGCGLFPTTDLKISAPASVTGLRAVDKPGWTTTTTGTTAEFSDGLLPAQTPDTFDVAFTAPNQPGTVLTFPVVQTCIDNEQVQWSAGADDTSGSAHPAPSVAVQPAAQRVAGASTPTPRPSSGTGHLLLIIGFAALLPVAAAGWWFTRTTTRPRR